MKLGLSTAVGTGLKATAVAGLAGVAWVNAFDPDPLRFRFIAQKAQKDGEAPGMQPALASVGCAGADTGANVGQVLHG